MPRIAIIAISTCTGLMARVAGEQRLDVEGLVGHHDEIDPARRDVHARQLVDDLVDLDDDDAVAEGGRLDQRRGVFGAGAGVDVAVAIGLEAGDQRDVGDQVHQEARVEFDVGVDGADFQQAVLEQLADAQALRTGEGKSSLRAICRSNRSRCSARLTLGMIMCRSCSLPGSALARSGRGSPPASGCCPRAPRDHRGDQEFQGLDDPLAGQYHAIGEALHLIETTGFSARRRDHCGGGEIVVVMATPQFFRLWSAQ